jgi:hypothetical protein
MNTAELNLGFERKIGYSFLGLLAGNVVSLVVFLIISALPLLDLFPEIRKIWNFDIGLALGLSVSILIVSMLGWVVVGLPTVLLLRAEIAADFYWATAAPVGAVLGLFTMLLIYLALGHGRLDMPAFRDLVATWVTAVFFSSAALIAGVAFAVYCALVQSALRKQAKESGAPKGTPRSLPWFDS